MIGRQKCANYFFWIKLRQACLWWRQSNWDRSINRWITVWHVRCCLLPFWDILQQPLLKAPLVRCSNRQSWTKFDACSTRPCKHLRASSLSTLILHSSSAKICLTIYSRRYRISQDQLLMTIYHSRPLFWPSKNLFGCCIQMDPWETLKFLASTIKRLPLWLSQHTYDNWWGETPSTTATLWLPESIDFQKFQDLSDVCCLLKSKCNYCFVLRHEKYILWIIIANVSANRLLSLGLIRLKIN